MEDEWDYSPPEDFDDKRRQDRRRLKIRRRHHLSRTFYRHREISAMEDVHLMNSENQPTNNSPIFGVYGADDWITNSFLKKAIDAGQNILASEGTWITEAGFKLHDWVAQQSNRYTFLSISRAFVFMSWGYVEAMYTNGKLELQLNGTPAEVVAYLAQLDTVLRRAESLIEWVYNSRGSSISVPLNYRPAINGAYPWLPTNINDYIDQYLNSQASVLILIGPPGTGKTTFIKNMIHRSGGDAIVTYDEKVMSDDSLFANFISGHSRFLIMEDADAFLKSRSDGNTMMHRFLNVSDGLVSAEGKKLVFSTNLPSARDIDEALQRPGRCFDVVQFRALKRDEAQVVADELGIVLPDGNEFTLAEMFNKQPTAASAVRPLGFI